MAVNTIMSERITPGEPPSRMKRHTLRVVGKMNTTEDCSARYIIHDETDMAVTMMMKMGLIFSVDSTDS